MNKLIILFFLLSVFTVSAQTDHETRAVWVATNFRLDWPPATYNQIEQQKALVNILNNIERKNLNVIYFQVRSNGTVFFESSYEPWTYYLTGEMNGKPDYDPLRFLISEAHKRGIEVHAWFNMLRCYSGSEKIVYNYEGHLVNKHPEWVRKIILDGQTSYWLDPGYPDVQKYLSNLVGELAAKYEVDGIQLDYIRYPTAALDDSHSYSVYGANSKKDDWRRANITAIVRGIKTKIDSINSDIKFGAAPIGIYTNIKNARGLQAYSEIFQESRKWLADGLMDYLVPQIYWNFQDNPKFDALVDDWVANSFGKNIVVGIASYKPDVKKQTGNMIEYCRLAGAAGVSFFRYEFIKDENYFEYKAIPSVMPWKEKIPPRPPYNLSVRNSNEDKIVLSWSKPEKSATHSEEAYFGLYKLNFGLEQLNSDNLFKIVPAYTDNLSFLIDQPTSVRYFFALKSYDKFWNESPESSEIVKVDIPSLKKMVKELSPGSKPVLINKNDKRLLVVGSEINDQLLIKSKDKIGKSITFENKLSPGINLIEIDKTVDFSKGVELEFTKQKLTSKIAPVLKH